MKKYLLAFLLLAMVPKLWSQTLNTYTFTSSSGTFTPITGGTLHATQTTTSGTAATALDDVNYSATLPFAFTFNNVVYPSGSTITINSNGFVAFGTAPAVNTYGPIGNTGTFAGAISPFGLDCNGGYAVVGSTTISNPNIAITSTGFSIAQFATGSPLSGTGVPTGATVASASGTTITASANCTSTGTGRTIHVARGSIRSEQVGSTFVIQWLNMRPYNATLRSFSCQVILTSGTNKVEVVYGPCLGSTTSSAPQVGLRGASNAVYNNRTTTADWSATVAGASNTASCTFSATVLPASGLTFAWEPPVVASPPNCAITPSPADMAINVARNPTLTWVDGGGFPTSYDVYFGTTTNPPLVGNVTTTSFVPTAPLAVTTQYYWKIVPKNANGPATGCVEWTFTTGANVQYCTPLYGPDPASNHGCLDGDVVARVVLNTLDNNSGTGCPSGVAGYSDYTATAPGGGNTYTTTLNAGTSYNCTIYAGAFAGNYAVWIDYNDDGNFATTERIGFTTAVVPVNGSATFPVSLACNPPVGTHRMRVREMFNTTGSTIHPCNLQSNWGEAEDYLITVAAPPPCPQPGQLAFTSATNTLAWVAGCTETTWDLYWQTPIGGTAPTAGTTPTAAGITPTPSHVPVGLTPGTTYEVWVRADCGGGLKSDWTGPISFTAPLPNDECTGAFTLTVQPFGANCPSPTTGTTVGASLSATPASTPWPASSDDDVWYQFTTGATQTGCEIRFCNVTFPVGTSANVGVELHPDCTTASIVNGNTAITSGSGTVAFIGLTASTNYKFRVLTVGTTERINFDISVLEPDVPPGCATLLTPADMAIGVVLNTPLTWSAPTTGGAPLAYRVYIWPTAGTQPTTPTTTVSATTFTYTPTGQTANTQYSWFVEPVNSGGFPASCTPYTYTTEPPPALPNCATQLTPADLATNVVLNTPLTWSAPTTGGVPQNYEIYIWPTPGAQPSTPTATVSAATLTYTPNGQAYGTTYSWLIIPTNITGPAVGCTPFTYTTEPAPPPPANDNPDMAVTLTLGAACTMVSATNNQATATETVAPWTTIPAPGCASYQGGDVWFQFTVPAGVDSIILDSGTGVITDGGMAVYSSSDNTPNGTFAFLECDDDDGNGNMSLIARKVEAGSYVAGNTYFVRFWEFGGNGNGTFTICARKVDLPVTILSLSQTFIEGYMSGGNMVPVLLNSGVAGATAAQCDTITVALHNAASPYAQVETQNVVLGITGAVTVTFPASVAGNSYYIVIKGRNIIETWSANPVPFTASTLYDFGTASQAYGMNLGTVGTTPVIYSGDIDHNGVIDLDDYPLWENDYNNFGSGYISTDIDGSGAADLSDYPFWENGYNNFIGVQKP